MNLNAKKILIAITVVVLVLICGMYTMTGIRYFAAGLLHGSSLDQGDIIFSKESGFYENEFRLKIYAPTKEVYYTLDGSDPDCNSIKYEGPILVEDASKNPNIYSENRNVTASFLEEEIKKYSANPEPYKIPE